MEYVADKIVRLPAGAGLACPRCPVCNSLLQVDSVTGGMVHFKCYHCEHRTIPICFMQIGDYRPDKVERVA